MSTPGGDEGRLAALGIERQACRRVLIVDDIPENLIVLRTLLEDEFELRTASDGVDALRVIEEEAEPFDLVVTDQRMPEMTGVELLARLRQSHPDTLGIVVTAYTDVEPMARAINVGEVHQFIFKPWNTRSMMAAVEEALALKAERDLLARLLSALAARQEALQETLGELEAAKALLSDTDERAMLGRLAAGVTHDVRNHLTALNVLVDGIVECTEDPEAHAVAERALQGMKGVMTLIRGIDTYARRAGMEVRRGQVATLSLLRSAAELFALGSDHEGGVAIEVAQGAAVIDVDASRVRQAVLAMLRRAEGGREAIRLVAEAGGEGDVVIRVAGGAGRSVESGGRVQAPRVEELDVEVARLVAASHGGSLEMGDAPGERGWTRLRLGGALA